METILSEIKRLQKVLNDKSYKFEYGDMGEQDLDELFVAFGKSMSINRSLYLRVRDLEGGRDD